MASELKTAEGFSYREATSKIRNIVGSSNVFADYRVNYKIPATLEVYVIVNKSFYALKDRKSGNVYLIDLNGRILEKASKTNLPQLEIEDLTAKSGEVVSDNILDLLKINSLISRLYRISSSVIKEGYAEFKVENGPTILAPSGKDPEVVAGALLLLISRLKGDDQNLKIDKPYGDIVIDLRFKNPVLR